MFNLPNPGSNPANPFYHRTLEEQRRILQEAVTVELDFKSDAEGKKAGGTMVRKGVYKMTFKDNAEMNKFMDTHADKLNESTPAYRKMMKKYKGSDAEKVFNMLRAKGYKVGEQDDTLVSNLLKRHGGNVKKVVDQIMKDYPGKFDVKKLDSRGLGVTRQSGLGTMKEDVEQVDEVKATARNIVKGLGDADGPFTVVAMKRDKVIKQETTKRRDMLPAIISTMRKEVGSGVTIAVEDKRGTIRSTFKESAQKTINSLDDYLAEGSE